MDEMTNRSFGYTGCQPQHPHQCTPNHITTQDWMQYINTYIDLRARQIYDKLKGQIGDGSTGSTGEVNVINQIKVNGLIQTPINKSVDISVPTDASSLPFTSGVSTKDKVDSIVGVLDEHIFDDVTGDYFILKDKKDPTKKYKVFIVDGTICSEEL